MFIKFNFVKFKIEQMDKKLLMLQNDEKQTTHA